MTSSISRERSPVAVLINPEKDIPLGERDIRVEDYLNDKLQSPGDLIEIAQIVENVSLQRKQLDDQLTKARAEIELAKEACKTREVLMLEKTKEFERQHANVMARLKIVTSSDTPEAAARLLAEPVEGLRKMELTHLYLQMIRDVKELQAEAKSCLPGNPKKALRPYMLLQGMATRLSELQLSAEGAAVHLVQYVQQTVEVLWAEMKAIMVGEFEAVLKNSRWPDPTSEPTAEWSDCIAKLLEFQMPEIVLARQPLILLPMGSLADPFVQQFRYHFYGDKPTNHPSQLGNYYFAWFVGTVSKWQNFLRENIGPLLAAHFRGNIYSGNSLYVDPLAAFVTALLPVMREKVNRQVEQIADNPPLFSKFMVQMMDFDEAIRSKFNYDGGNPDLGWKGLTWDVLDIWFDSWYNVEKKFAIDRYWDIMHTQNSSIIDYDSSGPGKTKPTFGAAKISDLIQNVTVQYRQVRKFSHKMKFLIGIQLEILDLYWGALKDSLNLYTTMTSTVGRAIHGSTKEQQAALQGVGKLETLCKVFGSAEHLISTMKDWSNEEFFICLWEGLQERARDTDNTVALAGEMSYTVVRDSTSDAMGSETEGAVFDKTIENYEQLRRMAESNIIQALKYGFPSSFKLYITRPQWSSVDDISGTGPSARTAELDAPLQELKASLAFLRKSLADAPFRRIWREALSSLADLIYDQIVVKQEFTTVGAAQLRCDFEAIQAIVDRYITYSKNSSLSMPKLREAIHLLNIPVEAGEGEMGLKEISEEIFAGAERTSAMLERLGMEYLSNGEARAVLARRLEASTD
ncbi:hypothetical protein LZ554_003788 [Drepanopeziza brunnea f. sp. 'monogermtubi']|nr:hypothetical protein LZ554_003788 [Drepanopeziza brunnea f. sp. 'monogermtubi']